MNHEANSRAHICYSNSSRSAATIREQCLIEQTWYAHYTLYNYAYFVGLIFLVVSYLQKS